MHDSRVPKKWRRAVAASLLLLAMMLNIAFVILGIRGYGEAFRVSLPAWDLFMILGEQLAGPLYTLAFAILFLWLGLAGKRFPWWMGLAGLLGPVYTPTAVGGLSHDFSHVVFESCSGVYGTWILWLNVAAGGLVIFHCLLSWQAQKSSGCAFEVDGHDRE